MFVVLLRFSGDRTRARELMQGHNDWIQRGLADGVFLLVGSLEPELGGAILARDSSRAGLERRIAEDPLVAAGVVSAELLEITPSRVDQRLGFLLAEARP